MSILIDSDALIEKLTDIKFDIIVSQDTESSVKLLLLDDIIKIVKQLMPINTVTANIDTGDFVRYNNHICYVKLVDTENNTCYLYMVKNGNVFITSVNISDVIKVNFSIEDFINGDIIIQVSSDNIMSCLQLLNCFHIKWITGEYDYNPFATKVNNNNKVMYLFYEHTGIIYSRNTISITDEKTSIFIW